MIPYLSRIIKYIIEPEIQKVLHSDTDILNELHDDDLSDISVACRINAAFLTLLSENNSGHYKKAKAIFNRYKQDDCWLPVIRFYEEGLKKIKREISDHISSDSNSYRRLKKISELISEDLVKESSSQFINKIFELFFPEGSGLESTEIRNKAVDDLRKRRKVTITEINPEPILHPEEQIVFTANILATLPLDAWQLDELVLSADIHRKIQSIKKEKQKYWYDHPIPLGIAGQKNEAIYGLCGLDEMVAFEKSTGRISKNCKLTCLLSASTTHDGLHAVIKDYFKDELQKNDQFNNLHIFIFTETDTHRIIDEILIPLIDYYMPGANKKILYSIFGVDGEYGRHYSFLKAIAAFWQVFINPETKATFKIDLDQVFPQQKLLEETGHSALDHFKTPLWGAKGLDSLGKEVDLSMIAGALVNQNDIHKSLFVPDITFPDNILNTPESLIFNSRIPQALSTEAEMMMQYKGDESNEVIQRIHVTGGTNGILIDALRKHRPFTPSIIGRAEDQAYLLSVLFKQSPALRYLHKPGLIMRHDKHTFASEAIDASAMGKLIGDYIRILVFSEYTRALPWDFDQIKSEIDPFTGAFVSPIPVTIVMLRFTFKMLELSETGDHKSLIKFQKLGSERLLEWFNRFDNDENYFKNLYKQEADGWNTFYDLLDIAETKLNENDDFVIGLKESVISIMENCRIKFD